MTPPARGHVEMTTEGVGAPRESVAVIGAGCSGLAALKNLTLRGFECVAYESHSAVGGIWDRSNPKSSVYRGTHLITSREVTGFRDRPMSADLPVYPRHSQVRDYLCGYAEHHDLLRHVRFDSPVTEVRRRPSGGWLITTASGETHGHEALVIANGHNWSPRFPELPGQFSGPAIHSRDYDTAAGFAGKRVLVVGAGNSGCDIAVESAQVADRVAISTRRGYHYYPKFLMGRPTDQVGAFVRSLRLPPRAVSFIMRNLLRMSTGRPQDWGLPAADHNPYETPPTISSLLPYYVAHGRVDMRPDLLAIDGQNVTFTDGRVEEFDAMVLATGFKIDIPFMCPEDLDWDSKRPDFYLLAFSRRYPDLFIAGMMDPTGGFCPTVDLQTDLIANYLWARRNHPAAALAFDTLKAADAVDLTGGTRFLDAPRNATQLALGSYLQTMREHRVVLRPAEPAARPPSPARVLASTMRAARSAR